MLFFSYLLTILLLNAPVKEAEECKSPDTAKISEAMGHLIGKNLNTLGLKLDIAQVIKGMQDAANGKQSPLSEEECIQALATAQQVAFKQQATENLEKAEKFLKENEKKTDVVVLDDGKLQYKIEKTGTGTAVEPQFTPVIKYVGKYIDGSVFGASKTEEEISLEETIPGFSKGIVGMKEGEKRILFVHPDYGYGTHGVLPPNSLLTFEVELVKANKAKEEIADSSSDAK